MMPEFTFAISQKTIARLVLAELLKAGYNASIKQINNTILIDIIE